MGVLQRWDNGQGGRGNLQGGLAWRLVTATGVKTAQAPQPWGRDTCAGLPRPSTHLPSASVCQTLHRLAVATCSTIEVKFAEQIGGKWIHIIQQLLCPVPGHSSSQGRPHPREQVPLPRPLAPMSPRPAHGSACFTAMGSHAVWSSVSGVSHFIFE